jgi:SAM-dependent methyltransferase
MATKQNGDEGGMALTNCPVCGKAAESTFLELPDVPVQCNVQWPSREAALAAPRGDIALACCSGCGMIWNTAFDPSLVRYDEQYENSLHFSPRFQEYAFALAKHLVETYRLYGKDIIEIGCGQGEFLQLLCALGSNRGLGFDPAYRAGGAERRGERADQVVIVRDMYPGTSRHPAADLICCRHVLEHLAEPRLLVQEMHRALTGRPEAVVYVEVPNTAFMLRNGSIWDVIYEHCMYFSATALTELFTASGYDVLRVREEFGGQYLGLEARAGQERGGHSADLVREAWEAGALARVFGRHYCATVEAWAGRLEAWHRAGRRVVIWGAGSKGVMFLNTLGRSGQIEYIVDINPRKQGLYVAGSGQRIVAPDFLPAYRPHIVLVMNPVYEDEVRSSLAQVGVSAQVLTTDIVYAGTHCEIRGDARQR